MYHKLTKIKHIYTIHKKTINLLNNTKNTTKPIPFTKNTYVPPKHLTNYITKFHTLLNNHNLNYNIFNHINTNILHIHPTLNIYNPQQKILIKQISNNIITLTTKYNNLL